MSELHSKSTNYLHPQRKWVNITNTLFNETYCAYVLLCTCTLHAYTHTHMYIPLGYIPGSTNEARRKVEHTNKYSTTINTVPRIGTNALSPSSMYLSKIFLILKKKVHIYNMCAKWVIAKSIHDMGVNSFSTNWYHRAVFTVLPSYRYH